MLVIAIDYIIPTVYPLTSRDNYLLGFENFYNSAEQSLGQNRIILVGGSSLGWGVSAETLTSNLGILTLNSGIHAAIGYKNFFRNISNVVDKHKDIIVISPEYFLVSAGGDLGRSKEFCFISIYVKGEYPLDCIGYSIASFFAIKSVLDRNKVMTTKDEYIKNGFNAFGDYIHRVQNKNLYNDIGKIDKCSEWKIQDLSQEYIPFIDEFVSQGYEVVYIPNFLPSATCPNLDKIQEFHHLMFKKYGIETFENAVLLFDGKYFSNNPYHLTKEGVALKTSMFEAQLRHYLLTR